MNESTWSSDVIHSATFQGIFYVIYTVIFVTGIFGNVLVCFVIIRNKTMQTVTNFFKMNLAFADILLCILAVPFTPLYSFLNEWIFGKPLCHLVTFAQGVSVYVSSLTLTSIAIDRYFVILHPYRSRMRIKTCWIIIVFIWTVSILITLPYSIFMTHFKMFDVYLCDEDWPSEYSRKFYGGVTIFLQFIIPFTIIAYAYVKISFHLNDRAKMKPGTRSSKKEEAERERKRATNRLLVAMVAVFGISWLPVNAVNLINDIYIPAGSWTWFNSFFFVAHAVSMSSTCYNPFLYSWLNENFRKEFKQVLPCFSDVESHRECDSRHLKQIKICQVRKKFHGITGGKKIEGNPENAKISKIVLNANQNDDP